MTNSRRVFISILVLLSHVTLAQGQTYIFGRANFNVGKHPTAVASGDFNGDGLPDLAITNSADNSVSILLGKPDSTFVSQVTFAAGADPVAIAAADFDDDGRLDLAIANMNCTPGKFSPICSPSTVSILLGNGDGTFQPHIDFAVGTLPSSVAVADLNGDGNIDLVVANAFDGTISVLLGNGDGTFKPQVVYASAGNSNWQSAVVGDFDGDGKLDLAVSCGSVTSVLLGNGDGTFRAHIDSGVGGISLAMGDFNGDGKLDLAVTGNGLLSVLSGKGDGTFVLQDQVRGGSVVLAKDLNSDGKLDLLLSGAGGDNGDTYNSVAILLGNGDGTFQAEVHYGTGNSPFGFTVMDLNGDGKFDLAVANSECFGNGGFSCVTLPGSPGTVSVLLGLGDGTFVGKTDYAGGGSAIATDDFNKDGNLDLVSANQLADSVAVLLGKGDGTFQSPVSYPAGHLPISVASGDFRNNGTVDLVTINETCANTPPCSPGSVSILLGNGDGTFKPHVDYGVGLVPYYVAVGDFRGNGNLDLAVANNGSASVSVLLGNGDGTFKPQISYLTASSPVQIATGDFNQDGKLDLAVDTGGGVSILLGNGDGTFKTHLDYPGGGFAIASGDFNGDGKLDLVTGGQNLVSILLGNGDGTFQAPINYQTNVLSGRTVFSIHVTDFNKDGKLDLAVNTETTEHVILLGNGDGTFQAPVEYLLANFISDSLTVGDFNGDGVPDWAAGDADGNTIGVMLSTAFKALSPSSLSFGSQDVGTISKAQTITISNPSNVNITIGSIASIGNFAETNNCGVDLKSGASCQLSITFSPSITGLQSGTINITDSTRVSPLAIPLSGIGVNEASLSFYPSRQNFSPQAVGSTSSAAAIVLENTGSAPLNLSAIGTTGVDSADFRQTNNCGGSLVPAGTCVVNVKFAPTAAGSRVASLSVSDTASGSPQIVALTGTGLGAAARFTPNTLAFLPQTVGTNSTAQAVLVTNTGNMPLSISSISISGDFAQTNSCNVTLSPGSNCQLSVVFTPTAVGNRAGIVTISDNALASPQLIAVSGTGAAAPDFTITSASGAPISQTISAGQSATFNLVVTPSGAFTGTVSLSCGISPVVNRAPTCGLSSSSLQLTGSSSQSLIVTVGSTGGALAGTVTAMSFPAGLMISAWVLLASAWLWFRNQRWRPEVASPLVVLAVLLWIGCGGSKSLSLSTPGTPSGTYTVTMMAASGNVNHAVTLTVVVR